MTAGLVLAAALVLLVGLRGAAFALAGFCRGTTVPCRDVLVRAATPAAGKVFGFVYSGFDLGSALTPPLLGWLVDRGRPQAVFASIARVLILTVGAALALPAFSRR